MWRLCDRMSKPPTLNCRRATDGSITAKVNGGMRSVKKWRRGGGTARVEKDERNRKKGRRK